MALPQGFQKLHQSDNIAHLVVTDALGLAQDHAWGVKTVVAPLALAWAQAYHASGLTSPASFLLQLTVVLICLRLIFSKSPPPFYY